MKKYLLGIFAIVLAVGFSAFTNKQASFVQPYVYEFTGDVTNQSEVEDEANWLYVGINQPLCDVYTEEAACRIATSSYQGTTLSAGGVVVTANDDITPGVFRAISAVKASLLTDISNRIN